MWIFVQRIVEKVKERQNRSGQEEKYKDKRKERSS
jgi:hypothetical protein